ncbi:DNA topoisomerase 6 subunit A3 [Setaria italica]|uniref:DNA topoisomerase 6 subunit A3 n=1 Tax=Setaria italica TaxID=4555 RepID=UPI000645B261|nr:DNA topoisomerase 6 subunit A3 [Setaria italica]XP_034571386.1 DNA topoisomerase 6 subunit A3 [Setaria viridis]
MAARAPLAMLHAAASASPRPAAAPVATRPAAPCLRARGTGGVPIIYHQRPAQRTRSLLLPAARPGAIGSAAEAAPAEGLAQKLQGVEVFDLSGKAVPIVDLWKDRKAVIAFARHFGCVLCRKRADLLAEKQDVMQAAGVALVLIGPGSVEQANAFCEQTKFKGEVYADPTHSSYDALEFAFGLFSTFTPAAGLKIIQLYREGYRQDWELSFEKNTRTKGGWYQGGLLVAGPGIDTILYIHKSLRSKLRPDASILATLRSLASASASSSKSKAAAKFLADHDPPDDPTSSYIVVADQDSASVTSRINRLVLAAARSILSGRGFSFAVPSRAASNQVYLPDLDRIVLLHRESARPFANVATARKATVTARVLSLVHAVLRRGIHVTKRDLFYTDVKLFGDQSQSDAVLDDVSCMLGCTRSSLHVVASEKGVVVGRLVFADDGDRIDCTRMGVGGKAIPPNIDRVSGIESDALFILLVEKDAAFMRLAEDRFYNRFPCIILTAKGQPDVATRLFLRRLKVELKLPVLALVDSDPYGLKILSVYMCGSKNMSYDSANLTTPDIKWLGVRPSDLDKYRVPEQCRLPMTDHDIKVGKELLEEDFVKQNEGWVKELETMLRTRQKAEIQALSSFGFQYLTEVYLPLKLQQQDWI